MDIPDTEYWCMYRAALWIIMRSFDVRDAVLYIESGDAWRFDLEFHDPESGSVLRNNPECLVLSWLEKNKSAMLPEYRKWRPELALKLAFDELAGSILSEAIEFFGPVVPLSELLAAMKNKRLYFHAQTLVKHFPIPEKPLSDREQAARDFLKSWQVRTNGGDPYRAAWTSAVRHVAATYCVHCEDPFEAAKKSVGKFITDEINRLRKSGRNAA